MPHHYHYQLKLPPSYCTSSSKSYEITPHKPAHFHESCDSISDSDSCYSCSKPKCPPKSDKYVPKHPCDKYGSCQKPYKHQCNAQCYKECLPKCGNLFMNACIGDYSCESLEYTKIFINSFPEAARCRVLKRVTKNSCEAGCDDYDCY